MGWQWTVKSTNAGPTVVERWAHTHLGLEHPEAHRLLGIHTQQKVGHPGDGDTALLVGVISWDVMFCLAPSALSFPKGSSSERLSSSSFHALGMAGASDEGLWPQPWTQGPELRFQGQHSS